MLAADAPVAVPVQVLEEDGVALQAFRWHAGRRPSRGLEVVDEGEIVRALDAELVDPAVVAEHHGLHHAHPSLAGLLPDRVECLKIIDTFRWVSNLTVGFRTDGAATPNRKNRLPRNCKSFFMLIKARGDE